MLSREEILNATDIETVEVKVPEWGGSVCVKRMTAGERDEYEAQLTAADVTGVDKHVRARLVAACVVDADGERMFQWGDVQDLSRKSANAVNRVFMAAARLNRLTEADVEEALGN